MKMAVVSARFTRGREPEPDFLGGETRTQARPASRVDARHTAVVIGTRAVVTLLAAARENELPNACVGRYPIARDSWAVFRCFSSCWAGSCGRARLDVPCSKLLILPSSSSHPGLGLC